MVIRKIAEMLGFYSAPRQPKTIAPDPNPFIYVEDLPKGDSLYRSGRHYHVTVGDDVYFWHGASKFLGPISDTYFDSSEDAHRFFTRTIVSCMPDFLDDDDIRESYEEFINAVESHIDDLDEDRPRDGIYFQPMELRLLVCDSCIPILSN